MCVCVCLCAVNDESTLMQTEDLYVFPHNHMACVFSAGAHVDCLTPACTCPNEVLCVYHPSYWPKASALRNMATLGELMCAVMAAVTESGGTGP